MGRETPLLLILSSPSPSEPLQKRDVPLPDPDHLTSDLFLSQLFSLRPVEATVLPIAINTMREESSHEVNGFEDEEYSLQQLEDVANKAKASVEELNAKLEEQNKRKRDIENVLEQLRERINDEGADTMVQKLVFLLKSLKELERQESEFHSSCSAKRSALEASVISLEEKVPLDCDSDSFADGLCGSLSESLYQLNSTKKELASQLRQIVLLKRQLDDVPCQSELIQYECRSSELNTYIQEKLRQTRKYYATFNALLEIKELMLKETSLLNSISSQFQDAFTTPVGRVKLIDSMERIVKSSQQKLEKVQLGFQEEQKVCDSLKEKYAAAVAEQRQCYSLLKTFQEECAKNEKLRSQSSA